MSQITRTYTFVDGQTAYGSQVESEVGNIVTTFNNHDNGVSSWTKIVCSGDVYTVDSTDYSSTSTIVGWSSFTTKLIYYRKVGKRVDVWFNLAGTSNSTTTSFTLPYANANVMEINAAASAEDNSSFLTTPGLIQVLANLSTASLFKDTSGANFTGSGTKRIYGQFWFYTA